MAAHLSPRTLSIAALVTVSASYTFLSIASRLMAIGFAPMTQVYLRIIVGTLILLFLFRKHLRKKFILTTPKKDWLVLLSMGTIGYSIAVYFVTLGVLNAKLVNVAVIFSTIPFFSYVYSYIFLKKKFSALFTALLIISFAGIAIIATKSFIPSLSQFGVGEVYTLIAVSMMTWFFVGRKLLSDHLNTREITIVVMTIAAISGIILALIVGETVSWSAFTNTHVLLGLAIGAVLNALVNPIEIYAFKHLDAVFGSQILLLENVFALIAGYLWYAEIITFPEIVGGLIVIGSVYYTNKVQQ